MTDIAFVKVYEVDSTFVLVRAEAWSELLAALEIYVADGKERLVRMQLITGNEYVTKISRICSILISTLDDRIRAVEIDQALTAERKEIGGNPWEV